MEQLHIKIPKDELEQAKKDACKLNTSLSEYVRSLLISGHNVVERVKNSG